MRPKKNSLISFLLMTVERDDNEVLYTKENVIISEKGSFRKDWWTVISIYKNHLRKVEVLSRVIVLYVLI